MTSSGTRFYAEKDIGKVTGAIMRANQQRIAYHEIDQQRSQELTTGVLRIVIPYTTPELTQAALRHAAVCTDLDVHVSLVDIQAVPFPCPLDTPPVDKKFSEQRLQELFEKTGLPGRAAVLYARDWLEGFTKVLDSHSLVILATRKRWWPTREAKLARALAKAGHQVMLLPVVR